ncbi:MAG: DUF3365 domain-containing protein [Sulfurimonas sp.]|jgi:hypothetical protein
MKLLKSITLLSLCASILLAAPKEEKVETPAELQKTELQKTIEIGESTSKLLIQTLGKNLKEHMSKGDVMGALKFCSDKAYALTGEVNSQLPHGVTSKRISLKNRNPANAPKENEAKILESFESLRDLNVAMPEYLVEKVANKTYKFYKPIMIADNACLECHGKVSKDIDLQREITRVYPLDKAVDYKLNDLRGAVVVTITHE